MDQLDIKASQEVNTEGLDYVLDKSRTDILENKVTLCVADGSETGIKTFDDLAEILKNGNILMAMGNQDVPVGQYTQNSEHYGLSEGAGGKEQEKSLMEVT